MPENYILLERTELNASAASVTFANIPQSGYTDLKIVISSRTNRANAVDSLGFYFNGDATVARYSGRVLYGTGSSAASNAPSPVNDETMFTAGNSATASTFGNSELYIPNYTSSNQKSASVDSVGENNATTARMNISAILYDQTTAISSVTFIPITGTTILEGSTFSLYGIAALGTTPVIAPKASGGNIIDFDGTNWIHTFTSSGTFTPQTGLTCDYLVVAGGGGGGSGGGNWSGGGGGAGGFRNGTGLSALAQSYTVTVGAGGAGATASAAIGTQGSTSTFSTISSSGGGYGGKGDDAAGSTVGGNGGSGGGGGGRGTKAGGTGNQGSYSPVEGYAGGNAMANDNASTGAGGGGGGSSAVGANATGATGDAGAGGNGTSNSITGSSVTYAGGGGGGGKNSGAAGGTGGGGAGRVSTSGLAGGNGTVNLGGGGGGGGTSPTGGGSGGSGIVIIRYPAA
jgi:hypothetical protein